MTPTPRNRDIFCDIFCAVVDNYGDAGVCWRLASQLAVEHAWRVRLWIDDPRPLQRLAPHHAGGPIEVRHWRAPWPVVDPADVVIEAFACEPPAEYVAAMARRERKPVWINLEYLSAEAWVASCHGQPSPHPRLPLVKHFFFPGFDAASGGLLREADYDARRAAFDETAFRAEFGLPARRADELTISMFAYPHCPLPELLPALARSSRPVSLLLPGGEAGGANQGALRQCPLPFLPQRRYDEILWASDLNFVRGEDSFVRAQWAAKPFVWHIYPQDGDAHLVKLDAFLDRHPAGGLMRPFWHAWNGKGHLDWPAFAGSLPTQASAAQTWNRALAGQRDLASALVQFSGERLK
ncbi:MAG: elongation factor P maturation arginine rhamnosyltransferase EarP [Rhodocyclales bacterium]|nr:elongation factor P maturation arginine rhamnosyltransferase EarP [Rhodocyclales bacterium]